MNQLFMHMDEYEWPLIDNELNTKIKDSLVLTETPAWETPNNRVFTLTAEQDCIVVAEWVATLWGDVKLFNMVDVVSTFTPSQYTARIDNWGFNVMKMSARETVELQLTNDGVMIDNVVQEGALDGASIVENVVEEQDIPSYFPGMLGDHDRNFKFQTAIDVCVNEFHMKNGQYPTVVDIGAGTGLLTHYALEAGARYVMCIEGNQFRAEFLNHRFADEIRQHKVGVFHGFSTICGMQSSREMGFPQQFDMLVTETLGTWAHFEKGHDFIQDFINRKIVNSTDYIIPQRICQSVSFRQQGEFAESDVRRSRRLKREMETSRFTLIKSSDTRVHELWGKLITAEWAPFHTIRLLPEYVEEDPNGNLNIEYPKNFNPREIDSKKDISLPQAYRVISREYKVQLHH